MVTGIAVSIVVALLVGFIEPGVIDTAANTEISTRTVPTIRDLMIALTAGAAGAYALSRPDVSNSLPGAAVAIALVPPLTVAGVVLSAGDVSAAVSAMLLSATNTLAVLFMGSFVFVMTGVGRVRRPAITRRHVRLWLPVGIATLAAGTALFLNGAALQSGGLDGAVVQTVVDDWLDDSGYVRYDLEFENDAVTVVLIGPEDEAPDADKLATTLSEELDRVVIVDATFLVGESSSSSGDRG